MYFKVKLGKSSVDDRGKKKRKKRESKKRKDPLLFEMWIFRNNPPVRDDSSRAFVTSYQEQRSLVEVAIDRVNS